MNKQDFSRMSERELIETLVRWSESAGSSLTALELDIARLRRDVETIEGRLMRLIETVQRPEEAATKDAP